MIRSITEIYRIVDVIEKKLAIKKGQKKTLKT